MKIKGATDFYGNSITIEVDNELIKSHLWFLEDPLGAVKGVSGETLDQYMIECKYLQPATKILYIPKSICTTAVDSHERKDTFENFEELCQINQIKRIVQSEKP